MKKKNYSRILNYVCVVLMLVILVLQFMPYWECEGCKTCEDGTVSIAGYVWFPSDHSRGIGKQFKEWYGKDFNINDVVTPIVILFVSAMLTVVLCAIYSKRTFIGLIPLVGGLAGAINYLTAYHMQVNPIWVLHMILCVLVVLASAGSLTLSIIAKVQKKKALKAA